MKSTKTVIDWTKLYSDYKGKWVALETDEETVIASAVNLKDLIVQVKKTGYEKPRYTRVPHHDHAMTAFYVANSSVQV